MAYQPEAGRDEHRMPAPNRKRHFRSRLVSPSSRLNARYDIDSITSSLKELGGEVPFSVWHRGQKCVDRPASRIALDRRPTPRARFAAALVDAKFVLIVAFQAGAAHIVRGSSSRACRWPAQDLGDGPAQAGRAGRHFGRSRPGPGAGAPRTAIRRRKCCPPRPRPADRAAPP